MSLGCRTNSHSNSCWKMALKAIPLVIQNNAAGIDYLFSFSVSGKGIGKALLKRVSAVSIIHPFQ